MAQRALADLSEVPLHEGSGARGEGQAIAESKNLKTSPTEEARFIEPIIEEPLKSKLRQRVALGSSIERLKRRDYASRLKSKNR